MLLILLSWTFISLVFFSYGLVCNRIISRVAGTIPEGRPELVTVPAATFILIQGMVTTGLMAGFISLFFPLSGTVLLAVFLMALLILFVERKNAAVYAREYKRQVLGAGWLFVLFFVAFALILAHLSSLPPSHHDDGLYYSTTIKWMEEYGVVKGLANVNPRLGFNSTWHLLHALFSFHYFKLGNFNDLNGLLLLLVFPYSLGGLRKLIRGDHHLLTLLRSLFFIPLMAFHYGASSDYLLYNINFLSSPAADLAVCLLLWFCLVLLCRMDFAANAFERNRQALMIVLFSAFLFTIKPSAAPVLAAPVFFFLRFLLKRQWLQAGTVAGMVLLVVGVWIVRNILVSGYLLFPFAAIDFLPVDWKLPQGDVLWHENAVRVFAINPEYDFSKPLAVPFSTWMPVWFDRLTFIQALSFIAALLSFFILFVVGLVQLIKHKKLFLKEYTCRIFTLVIAGAGFLLWFFKGPDFRLGYGFVGITCILALSLLFRYFLDVELRYLGYLLGAVVCYTLFFYYRPVWREMPQSMAALPPARKLPGAFRAVPLMNSDSMYLVDKDDSWYCPLPVANTYEYYSIRPELRGHSIKEGFKPSNQ